ncbi:hypothetical protein RV14_GL001806 [Enterococcus ratti]|uniref:Uncharacterized protein n=1 Tax=Enterococcus ratti TaxID=150033 RepID=A0A1L8WQ16_9ENTE|nr:hypothetical protein RV14_GL001806 [Enterococcus ratti]
MINRQLPRNLNRDTAKGIKLQQQIRQLKQWLAYYRHQ